MSRPGPLRLGVVGAGGFAAFVTGAIRDLPEVRVVAVTDVEPARTERMVAALSARPLADWRALIGDEEVDAVIVTTPPATHAEITLAALRAGRHVFCEKPMATDKADADAVRNAATDSDRVLLVDHVLRYNPILRALIRLRDLLLGPVQRFAFENDASDEDLDPGHWFWDEKTSGGIFVEHGVHFFDAASALIGSAPEAVQGMVAKRPGTDLVDLAVATARYSGGVLATFAHGFNHAHRCERQLTRIDFGTAEARVTGWIPVHAVVDIWTDDAGAATVETLPGRADELLAVDGYRLDERARIDVGVDRDAGPMAARARGTARRLPHHARVTIDLGGEPAKLLVYTESVRAAMADLASCARSGSEPLAGPAGAWAAVHVAAAARRSAREGATVYLDPAGPAALDPAYPPTLSRLRP